MPRKIVLQTQEDANSCRDTIHLALCDWGTANGYRVDGTTLFPIKNGDVNNNGTTTTTWYPVEQDGSDWIIQSPTDYIDAPSWKKYYHDRGGIDFIETGESKIKFGVNFGSASFAPTANPRRHNVEYVYTDNSYVDYYADLGLNMIRVAFRWEAIQPNEYDSLDSDELARLKSSVDYILSKNMIPIIDVHNYGSYKNSEKVDNVEVPYAVFADLWTKLANEFSYDTRIEFDLMNEPTGRSNHPTLPDRELTPQQWVGAVQAAITAIRETGATNKIYVGGTAFSGGHRFISSGWADVVSQLNDPMDNMVLTVHQYLDSNASGGSGQVASVDIGVERLQAVTEWCRENGYKLYLGETNAGERGLLQSSDAYIALQNMFRFIKANDDVWEGVTLWSGGAWWPDNYHFNLEPQSGVDDIRLTLGKTIILGIPIQEPNFQTVVYGGNNTITHMGNQWKNTSAENPWNLQQSQTYPNILRSEIREGDLRTGDPSNRSRAEWSGSGLTIDFRNGGWTSYSVWFESVGDSFDWNQFTQLFMNDSQENNLPTSSTEMRDSNSNWQITASNNGENIVFNSNTPIEVGKRYDILKYEVADEVNGRCEIWINGSKVVEEVDFDYSKPDDNNPYVKFGLYAQNFTGTAIAYFANFEVSESSLIDRLNNPLPIPFFNPAYPDTGFPAFDAPPAPINSFDAGTANKTFSTGNRVSQIQGTGVLWDTTDANEPLFDATLFNGQGGLIADLANTTLELSSINVSNGFTMFFVAQPGDTQGTLFSFQDQFQERFRQDGDGTTGNGIHWDDQEIGNSIVPFGQTNQPFIVGIRRSSNDLMEVMFNSNQITHSYDPRGFAVRSDLNIKLFNFRTNNDGSLNAKIGHLSLYNEVLTDAQMANIINNISTQYGIVI